MTATALLDPKRDCAEIARHIGTVVFPWDTTRSLELALFRAFASPRIGGFWFWRGIGERMQIHDLPDDIAQFERFSRAYEAEHFRYTEANRRVALATREMFAGWFPRPLRPLVRHSIHGLLDAPLRVAFGLPTAPRWLAWTAQRALRARAIALHWMPKRKRPVLRTQIARVDYPQGYRIESLGPPPVETGNSPQG